MTPRRKKTQDPDTLAERNLKKEVDDLVGQAKDLLVDLEIKAQDAENMAAQCRAQAQRIRDLLGIPTPKPKSWSRKKKGPGRKKGTTRKKASRSARRAATAPTVRRRKDPQALSKAMTEAVLVALANPAPGNLGRTLNGIQEYLAWEAEAKIELELHVIKKILEVLEMRGKAHLHEDQWIRTDRKDFPQCIQETQEKKPRHRGGSKSTRPPMSGSPAERKAIIEYLKFLDLRDHGASVEDIHSRLSDTCNAWTLDLSQTLQVLEGMMAKKVVRLDRETSKWHIVKNTGNSQAQKDGNMETS